MGQDILRGLRLLREVTPADWLHLTLATLTHDIGYVRGICQKDEKGAFVKNERGEMFSPPSGASDAALAPSHIERSKIVVKERFEEHPFIDAERLAVYLRKLNALFHEFGEIGVNAALGYSSPADIAESYPRFFWTRVEPFIGHALTCLALTVEGRQWTANLYCNVFEIEHRIRNMGPQTLSNRKSEAGL